MKIGLIMTGHPRQFKDCYPSVKQFILDKHNVDVYISTWDHNFNHIERKHLTKPFDPMPVIDLYKPVNVHIENHIQYYENKKVIQFTSKFKQAKIYHSIKFAKREKREADLALT